MTNDTVYLTFRTDRNTSEMLKFIAHNFNLSQPEFINFICKEYINELINDLNDIAKEELKEKE